MHILTAKVHEFRGLVTKRKMKCSMWWNVVGSSEITECYMFYFRFLLVHLALRILNFSGITLHGCWREIKK